MVTCGPYSAAATEMQIAQIPPSARVLQKIVPGVSNARGHFTEKEVQGYLHKIDPDMDANICSFASIRLGTPLQTVLLVSIDVSHRDFCNSVLILGNLGEHVWSEVASAWQADDVSKLVDTPNGATHPYLIVPREISDYNGAMCIAAVPRVYDLKGKSLLDVSRKFPMYYQKLLSTWMLNDASRGDAALCNEMELDKLKRMAGISPDAGFTTAITWMSSKNTETRSKAIRILADIGDVKSLEALQKMTADGDRIVARKARRYLRWIEKARVSGDDDPDFNR
jgi:hypothetical protein